MGKFGPSQGDDGLSFIGLICIVHLCPARADATWCRPNLILTWKNTLENPAPPPPPGTRWQYLHVTLGGIDLWESCVNTVPDGSSLIPQQQDIDMQRCQWPKECTSRWMRLRCTRHRSKTPYISSNQLLSLIENLIFMQMRELVCVSVHISLHMSHMSLSRRKGCGGRGGVIRWRSTVPFYKKEVSIDLIHHYTTLQLETFFILLTINILSVSFWKGLLAALTSRCQLPHSF